MMLIRRLILAFVLMAGLVPAFAQAPPPVPALPDSERRTSYSISGTTCSCAVNFALFGDSTDFQNWLEVFVNGVLIPQSGNWTITSPTGPLATIPRPITDAVLTFTAAQTGTVQIVGARRPRRTAQFAENRGVAARDLNQALTDIIAQNRETWDKTNDFTGRGLFSQPGNTLSMLPLPSVCAGKFLGFDATGLIPQCSAGGAGSGNVVGPVSSIVGHIPTWNNTTGTLLADSGISVIAAQPAVARMWPNVGQTNVGTSPWQAIDPFGNAINCAGTNSQCLQEFLNATTSNGWPAVVDCKGVNFPGHAETVFIESTVSITVPVAQNWSFHSYGCNLNFNVTTVPGLIIDSQGATHFDWDGLIIYNVTTPNGDTTTNPSCGVYMNPTTNTADGFASIYDGYFRIKSVAVNVTPATSTATAAVCMNTTTGGIHDVVEFQELVVTGAGPSQPGAFYGLLVYGLHGAQGSRITVDHPHGATNSGVKNLSTANPGGVLWTVNDCNPGGSSSKCIWEFGSNNDWRIGTIGSGDGGLQYGIFADTGACNNRFTFTNVTTASASNWFDTGTCNSFNGPNSLAGFGTGVQNWTSQFVGTNVGAGPGSAHVSRSTQPAFTWDKTDGAADAKFWDAIANANVLELRAVNDANSVANDWAKVTRSGATITQVQFPDISDLTSTAHSVALGQASGNFTYAPNATAGSLLYASGASTDPAFAQCLPNIQSFISGTAATYTTPSCTINGQAVRALQLDIELWGGGAGGRGGGTGGGAGGVGNTTSISTFTATGGAIDAGAGGSCTGSPSLLSLGGGIAGSSIAVGTNTIGGPGGTAPHYGATTFGILNGGGATAGANTGSGGSGGGSNSSTAGGAGGSGGAFCRTLISSPAVSYTYTVAAAASGGTAGTSGSIGGGGAAGGIIVTARWQ